MKRLSLLVLCGLPLVALGNPKGFGPGPHGMGPGAMGKDPERREQAEQRHRTMMVVGLSEVLELNEAEALKLAAELRVFDERRRPIRQEMREAMETVRLAAQGDSGAQGKVDQAISRLLDARAKLAALDKEQYSGLAKNLSPQKRAKLVLAMAHLKRGNRGMKGHPGMGGPGRMPGPGGAFGPGDD